MEIRGLDYCQLFMQNATDSDANSRQAWDYLPVYHSDSKTHEEVWFLLIALIGKDIDNDVTAVIDTSLGHTVERLSLLLRPGNQSKISQEDEASSSSMEMRSLSCCNSSWPIVGSIMRSKLNTILSAGISAGQAVHRFIVDLTGQTCRCLDRDNWDS